MSFQGTRIGVVVRIRPLLQDERRTGHKADCLHVPEDRQSVMQIIFSIQDPEQALSRKFQFDHVFDETVNQQELFYSCKLDMLIRKVTEGFNATIFAYGQTGSGKTFTMEGYEYDKQLRPVIRDDNSRLGITPRAIKTLFSEIARAPNNIECNLRCTFIQIYQERIYDLLNPAQLARKNAPSLKIRWNKTDEFYVENLFTYKCNSAQDALHHYQSGLKNKIMSAHNLNSMSSRSHCMLTLIVEAVDRETGSIVVSRLQLVDLAGSERNSLTGNTGVQMKEAIEINKSLFTLRQVITALSTKGAERPVVPYRDSKLTSLLKQSIGGNSFCLMIACLSPSNSYLEENLSTLTYATQTAFISNVPVKNLDPKTQVVHDLKKEMKEVKQEASQYAKQVDVLIQLMEFRAMNDGTWENKLGELERLTMSQEQISRIRAARPQGAPQPSTIAPVSKPPVRKKVQKSPPPTAPILVPQELTEQLFLTPELLSAKLNDSVKMIKDLVAQNRELKSKVQDLTYTRRNLEGEKSQLQIENEDLREKVEMLEDLINSTETPTSDYLNILREKEELRLRLEQMENEQRQVQNLLKPTTNSRGSNQRNRGLNWKGKPKVQYSPNKRNSENDTVLRAKGLNSSVPERRKRNLDASLEPISQPTSDTSYSTKDEAIDALSKLLHKRAAYTRSNKLNIL